MSTTYNIQAHQDQIQVNGICTAWASTPGYGVNVPSIRESLNPNYYSQGDWGYVLEFVAHCTQLQIGAYQDGTTTTFQTSVDGAAPTAYNGGGTGSGGLFTLATGLTAGKHLFRVFASNADYLADIVLVGGNETLNSTAKTQAFIANNQSGYNIPVAPTVLTRWGTYTPHPVGDYFYGSGYAGYVLEFGFVGSGVDWLTVAGTTNSPLQLTIDGGSPQTCYWSYTSGGSHPNNIYTFLPMIGGLTPGAHTASLYHYDYDTVGHTVVCVRIYNGTHLAASAAQGATTMSVAASTGYVIGDWLQLDMFPFQEYVQVTGISGTTLSVTALNQAHSSGAQVSNFNDPAGSLSQWQSRDLSRYTLCIIGDSISAGAVGDGGLAGSPSPAPVRYDNRNAYGPRAGVTVTANVVDLAIQGSTAQSWYQGTSVNGTDIAAYAAGAGAYVILLGTNDCNSSISTVTFQTYYQDIVTACLAANTTAHVYCCAIFTPLGGNLSAYNTVIAAVAAGSGARCSYVDLSVGMNVSIYDAGTNPAGDLYDSLHPAPSGQIKMASRLAGYLVPSPLVPGSATGSQNAAASLSAQAPTGGLAPYTYQWYRSTTLGVRGSAIGGATALTYFDTGLTGGTTYYYTVVATDSTSTSVASTQVAVVAPGGGAAAVRLSLTGGL